MGTQTATPLDTSTAATAAKEETKAISSTRQINIVRGVALSPPVIGRIGMGHTVLRKSGSDVKAIPVRDDHFTITTLVQEKATREWERHPLHQKLTEGADDLLLRAIPVRIAYNDPALNLQNRHSCFDRQTGRAHCMGNGRTARRVINNEVQTIDCPGSDTCEYGKTFYCKNMTRAYFRIEGQEDELGTFILRTGSHNSLTALATRFEKLGSLTGQRMANMPMLLIMVSKTSQQSNREAFQFADLVQRPGMSILDAAKEAQSHLKTMADAGLQVDAMEATLRAGMQLSDFADSPEDIDEWLSDENLVRAAGGTIQEGTPVLSSLASIDEHLRKLSAQHAPPEGEGENPDSTQAALSFTE